MDGCRHDEVVALLTSRDNITLVVTRESSDPSLIVYRRDDHLNRNIPHIDNSFVPKSSSSSTDNLLSGAKPQAPSTNPAPGNSVAPVHDAGSKHRSKRAQSSSVELLTDVTGNSEVSKTAAKPHQNTNTRHNTSSRSLSVSEPPAAVKVPPTLPMTQTFAPPVVLAHDISQPTVRLESNPVVLTSDTVTTATAKIPSSPVVQMKMRAPSTGKKSRTKNNSVATPGESQPSHDAASKNNVASLFDVLEKNYVSKGGLPNGDVRPSSRNSSNRESYGFNSVYGHNQPYPVEVSMGGWVV